MKRRVLPLIVLLAVSTVILPAETILVFTRNSLDGERTEVARLQAAIEDGVMETFFDTGHIVFNAGFVTANEPLAVPSERLSFRMAKSGGALYLLEIDLDYREIEEQVALQRAEYRFYQVISGQMLLEGNIDMSEVSADADTAQRERCTLMGESIAGGALASL